jgi:hypothetical protein
MDGAFSGTVEHHGNCGFLRLLRRPREREADQQHEQNDQVDGDGNDCAKPQVRIAAHGPAVQTIHSVQDALQHA